MPFPDPGDAYNLDLAIPAAVMTKAKEIVGIRAEQAAKSEAKVEMASVKGNWRFVRGEKELCRANYEITADAAAPMLERIDETLGTHPSTSVIRKVLRAEVLLQNGLNAAALREVLPWVDRTQKKTFRRDLRVFLIAHKALAGLFSDERKLNQVSELFYNIASHINDIDGWSVKQRGAAFNPLDK